MAIFELLKTKNPYMLAIIMRIYCLGPYAGMESPELVQKMHEVAPNPFYKRMMEQVPGFAERLPR